MPLLLLLTTTTTPSPLMAPLPLLTPAPPLMPMLPHRPTAPLPPRLPLPPLLPLLARPPLPGLYPRPQLLSALASFISRGGDAKPYKEEEEEESLSALANKFGELPAKATAIGGPLGTMAGTVVPMVMGGGTPGGSDIHIGQMLATAPDRPSSTPNMEYAPMMKLAMPLLLGGGGSDQLNAAVTQAFASSEAAKTLGLTELFGA